MIAQPTKGSQLEGSSNQQKIVKNWIIAQPTNGPHVGGSSKPTEHRGKLDYCQTDKMPPIRRF